MRDHGVEDPEFEPFDALLEEVLRERSANGRAVAAPAVGGNVMRMRRGSQWLAAMWLLLGVGVVGAMLGRRDESDGATKTQAQWAGGLMPGSMISPVGASAGVSQFWVTFFIFV